MHSYMHVFKKEQNQNSYSNKFHAF